MPPTLQHPPFIAGHVHDYRYFFLNLVPQKRELTVACGGWERCTATYRVDRSDFEFFGLEYVAQGHGTLTLNGRVHDLRPGTVFAYQPLSSHKIKTNPDDPLVKYFIDFSGRDAGRLIGQKGLGIGGVAFLSHAQPIHDLYEQMLESGQKGGHLAPRLCSLLLELLAVRIEESAQTSADARGRARQTYDRCQMELRKHFRTIPSVSELAARMHMDPAYLARLFVRFGGESPYQMLTRLKINEAASHLLGGGNTVKEVAAQVGFGDPYHFSRLFKKHHGIAPAQFRKTRLPHLPRRSL